MKIHFNNYKCISLILTLEKMTVYKKVKTLRHNYSSYFGIIFKMFDYIFSDYRDHHFIKFTILVS